MFCPERCETPPAPRFPMGFRVNLGYLGLYRADEPATNRKGDRKPLGNAAVIGMRLEPEDVEEWDDATERCYEWVTYPKGWEYLLSTALDIDAHGWYTEAELIEKGYEPPVPAVICDGCGMPATDVYRLTPRRVECAACVAKDEAESVDLFAHELGENGAG